MRHLLAFLLLASSTLTHGPRSQSPCFESNLGVDLQLTDDDVAQGRALGFAFPFAGRTITAIDISSNGFVWLGSNSDSGCCDGDLTRFLNSTARIAPLWVDLNPSAGGAVHFATFAGRAVITWNGVPEYGESSPITVQLQLFADGAIQMTWQAPLTVLSHTTLVGVTPGGGATNPRAIDFANGLPFDSGSSPTIYELFPANTFDLAGRVIRFAPNTQGGFAITRRTDCRFAAFTTNGTGCPASLPVALLASSATRPAIGTNFDMIVGEAPAGAGAGVMLYGTPVSTSLTPIGMTGCTLYASAAVVLPFVVQGRYSVVTLPIPNDQGLVGVALAAQAALAAPGANPAGAVTSNGGRIEIGT